MFITFGILLGLAAVAVWQIHVNRFPGNQFIMPWYEEAYQSDGKTVLKGDDYVSWAEMGAGALVGLGIVFSIVARMNAGKRYRPSQQSVVNPRDA